MTNMVTLLPVVSRTIALTCSIADRLTSARERYPLFVCALGKEILAQQKIQSRIMYGHAAWVEISAATREPVWAGFWGENFSFWLETEYKETIDLNTPVAHRRGYEALGAFSSLHSPPILWSRRIPSFYKYIPQGLAETDLTQERDLKWFETARNEARDKLAGEYDFPNVPIIGPEGKLLDDSQESFKQYDEILTEKGIPQAPF